MNIITILNVAFPYVLTAVIILLGRFLGPVLGPVSKVLINLIEWIATRLMDARYAKQRQIAIEIWHMVDEHFRITDQLKNEFKTKADMFNKFLLAKCPELKQEDIDYLRQTIAGEVNKDKLVLSTDDKIIELQTELNELKKQNETLTNTNDALNSTLNSFKLQLENINK